MDDIRVFFRQLIESGKVHGHIEGPRDNVLVCDTLSDWVRAGGELIQAGYEVDSPGGFGGSTPASRANTHNKIWRSGTVCATVIQKRVFVFSLPQTTYDHCDVIHKKKLTRAIPKSKSVDH